MKPPFEASRRDSPYVFVSYAHADAARVYPELESLRATGYEIWYDEGISPGHDWPEELASAISECALFLLFVTPASVRSENCTRETTFALSRRRPFLAVHLEETRLPAGLELSIGASQAILRHALDETSYRRKLTSAVADVMGKTPVARAASPTARQGGGRRIVWIAALAVAAAGAALFAWQSSEGPAADADLARLESLIASRETFIGGSTPSTLDAFLLARTLAERPNPPAALEALWPAISTQGEARTVPDGVAIALKESMADPEWIDMGTSGTARARFPRGQFYWRFSKEGYQTSTRWADAAYTFAAPSEGSAVLGWVTELRESSAPAQEPVARTVLPPAGVNYITPPFTDVPGFRVDRYEVTNRDYKAFVDAGGYANAELFAELVAERGSGALRELVDETGRPGPATWELGTFPAGEADHPVGGVSWYEAKAYARFRGAALPTVHHWTAAALPFYASTLAPHANFDSGRTVAVTSLEAPEPRGTLGIYGNVREWVANAWGERRWILGGGWSDPTYLAALPFSLPPTDRSPVNGIRLYHFDEPYPAEFDAPYAAPFNDYRTVRPVSDETYAVIADQYVDVGEALRATPVSRSDEEEWVREVVRLNADIPGEHFDVHLFLPRRAAGKSQAIVYFPPIDTFWARGDSARIALRGHYLPLDIVPRGGRALVWPVYYGSLERYNGVSEMNATRRSQVQTELRMHWYADMKRTLDYLATRADIDVERLGFLGFSYGASHSLPLLALEKRFKAAVLVAGGLGNLGVESMPQAADPINFVSRITIPVLMINGKSDFVFPLETSQRPLFELLGSAPADKRKIEYDGDHYRIPATPATRDIADFLDARLGTP